jgi:hypothetical protein
MAGLLLTRVSVLPGLGGFHVVARWAFFVLFAVLTLSSQGISRMFAAVAAICGLVAAIILTLATRRVIGSRTVSDGRPPSDLPSS